MTDETIVGGIDDYSERMLDLMREAAQHGIVCYTVLHTTAPISRTSQTRYCSTADHVLAMGMLAAASLYQQDDFINPCDDEDDEERV